MKKVCLTTFVYGKKYQEYIPFLLYTCHKAYPEYDVILFLYEKLDLQIKDRIDRLKLTNKVLILEEQFKECKDMTPLKSQSLRWVLWHDNFWEYDFLYIVDIDVLYIQEPVKLHIQHEEHIKTLGLPFSNIRRVSSYNPFLPKTLIKRIEAAGFSKLFAFFSNGFKPVDRLTGLHFISIPEYYSIFTQEKIEQFRNDILTGKFLEYILSYNDEVMLAYIMKNLGFDITKLGIRIHDEKMLHYDNFREKEFRPIHGIHLGIYRIEKIVRTSRTANSSVYKFYYEVFKKEIMNDQDFIMLLKETPDIIKDQFRLLYKFIDISSDVLV